MKIFSTYLCPMMLLLLPLLLGTGCQDSLPLTPERYTASDKLFAQLEANVAANPVWHKVSEIDHSRLGAQAGSNMPPSRVIIFSNPYLESRLVQQNPLVALDLPLRVLAYEASPGGDSKVIYNSYSYLQSRYNLPEQSLMGHLYEESMAQAMRGILGEQRASFAVSSMEADGIITIDSPFNFGETMARIAAAIDSQDDTVGFGTVDFKKQAANFDLQLPPSTLILFGAPEPGAKAMSEAPTLGLDAFCQKFLVWQDADGKVHLSYNDLLALAQRQGVGKSLPLRVISYRLNKVFGEALEPQ